MNPSQWPVDHSWHQPQDYRVADTALKVITGRNDRVGWGAHMGGHDAIRGYEYQFLCALEYALSAVEGTDSEVSGIYVESPLPDTSERDHDAIDFAIQGKDEPLIVAQVKSGAPSSTMSGTEALWILLRLITGPAVQYVLLTNRKSGPGLDALSQTLADAHLSKAEFRKDLAGVAQRSPALRTRLGELGDQEWERLRGCRIRIDDRDIATIRIRMRERVRTLRRRLVKGPPGWDAAGLLLGHLLWDIVGRAAAPEEPFIRIGEITNALAIDGSALAAAMVGKEWLTFVNVPPRLTDIARPGLLSSIETVLRFPNESPQVPVCVLTGLSGVGKTSVAVAWAADRSDEYRIVFWVDASGLTSIENSFASIDRWLSANISDSHVSERLVDRVLTGLSRLRSNWLIVFDNAVNQREIREWMPRQGIGHAMVTTTDRASWRGPFITSVTVPVMQDTEAVQLLRTRLAGEADSLDEREALLLGLAERLQYWPLALELASAYLADCGLGLESVSTYEGLLMRALADEDSIPAGYPRTLVSSVLVAWKRMETRAAEDKSAEVALNAMWFAAFMHSRQIPLHLLMACVWLDPHLVVKNNLPPMRPYAGREIPVGEVVRALLRQSLVTVDTPVFVLNDDPDPHSLAYSVSMNEIVQAILRGEAEKREIERPVLSQLAFFAQHWLTGLLDAERLDLVAALLAQCLSVSEFALHYDLDEYTIALLWGNTASALSSFEEWAGAERYSRAEIGYLSRQESVDVVMALTTHVQLVHALVRGAVRPSDVIEEVANLLTDALKYQAEAMQKDSGQASMQIINASTLSRELRQECPRHHGIQRVAQIYRNLVDELSTDDPRSMASLQMLKLNELVRDGDPSEVLGKARELWGDPTYSFHQITILRFMVEANIELRNWDQVTDLLDGFAERMERGGASYLDVNSIFNNVAAFCVGPTLAHEPDAVATVSRVVDIADRYAAGERQFTPGDRARIGVYRAYVLALRGDFEAARQSLTSVDLDELNEAEAGRSVGADHMYQLLQRWVGTMPSAMGDA